MTKEEEGESRVSGRHGSAPAGTPEGGPRPRAPACVSAGPVLSVRVGGGTR